ncbi:MAG: hypothetical protein F6J93_11005 [Oscillatoria sp. SIO1A7]|nr:hypothetical protein [Oscillatoria sp. SIO1A7]
MELGQTNKSLFLQPTANSQQPPHPTPYTLHPKNSTATPYAPHPTPNTPKTLHPTPQKLYRHTLRPKKAILFHRRLH